MLPTERNPFHITIQITPTNINSWNKNFTQIFFIPGHTSSKFQNAGCKPTELISYLTKELWLPVLKKNAYPHNSHEFTSIQHTERGKKNHKRTFLFYTFFRSSKNSFVDLNFFSPLNCNFWLPDLLMIVLLHHMPFLPTKTSEVLLKASSSSTIMSLSHWALRDWIFMPKGPPLPRSQGVSNLEMWLISEFGFWTLWGGSGNARQLDQC